MSLLMLIGVCSFEGGERERGLLLIIRVGSPSVSQPWIQETYDVCCWVADIYQLA